VATIDIRITHNITLWYRNLSIFNALLSSAVPTVTPKAVNIFLISSFSNTYGMLSPRSKSYHVTAESLETFSHALLSRSCRISLDKIHFAFCRILLYQKVYLAIHRHPLVLRWTISRAFMA
jgi:hypothetical protein